MTALVETLKLRQYPIGIGRLIVWFFAAAGVAAMIARWAWGLGITTNMVDDRGWGIWISFDILTGIAISAGAFTLAAVVYIFNLKQFYPLVRPTILTGFIGYLLAASTLLVDLGFPYRIWHLILYWNVHSPLFEVGWCVMIYLSVLALEFSPALFERLGWKVPLRITRAITIPLVIFGIVLSTMHQSSLGTLMTIFPDKIHPLWYSKFNPIFFYVSAIGAGIAMIVMETHFSAQAFRYKFEGPILAKLVKAIPWVLGLYLVGKLADLVFSGKVQYVFAGGWPTVLYLIEILVGVVAPIYLFSKASVRRNRYKMFWSATLVVFGLLLNRFNVSLIFLDGAPYLPAWTEILVTFGLISIGIIIYDLAFRTLPVLQHAHE